MKKTKLMLGDNVESLKKLPDNSIDSVVTDPPYGLSFMNKKWDYDVPSVDFWKEVYRVLKPGGHVLSFGGTRTYHRMVVNIEDAGFEIRDQIMWLYGSGFPKSHNIGKAVDKIQGNEREVVGEIERIKPLPSKIRDIYLKDDFNGESFVPNKTEITKGNSQYEGWGTALKPANEPICVARKPLSEDTVAENVLKWGTGGINVDGCRIGTESVPSKGHKCDTWNKNYENLKWEYNEGRFPANIILDEIAGELLDEQSGFLKSGSIKPHKQKNKTWKFSCDEVTSSFNGDSGGASRFFYQAKVSKAERNMSGKCSHPTLKPVQLMSYLCRLVTPPNGIVLDPFMGSGSTGISAQLEGFRFVGMEMDSDYFKIAEARINSYEEYRKFIKK